MAVEGKLIKTHAHFRNAEDNPNPSQLGRVFAANDSESYKVKYNEYPKWEPVPFQDEDGCCCCCGCVCTCTMDILGEIITLTDESCEIDQWFAFVKHRLLIAPVEARQVETYSEPLECGEYPEIGGINLTITKESIMESHLVSIIKAVVTKSTSWYIDVEQTEKLFTFYYRRITIDIDQTCTIPDAAWRINPTTSEPEIVDSNYGPACMQCKIGALNILSGAGIKPCCTDNESDINCVFSVVDGKGQIAITGTIVGLWEYEDDGKCLKPALNGPVVSCQDGDKKYYELNSHVWDDARHGRVGFEAPVIKNMGCIGEPLRVRRKLYKFNPLQPATDDNDTPDTLCESFEKGNVSIDLLEDYDSRALGLFDYDGLVDVVVEVDSTRSFDPNSEDSDIIDSPVTVGGATETRVDLSTDVEFFYEVAAPACKTCMLEIEVTTPGASGSTAGPVTNIVELPEPGCYGTGVFCYRNIYMQAEFRATHTRFSEPRLACVQQPTGEDCEYDGPDAGIYIEYKTETRERFYISTICRITIRKQTVGEGGPGWYAIIAQTDSLVHVFYIQDTYTYDFGAGCFYNNCGEASGGFSDDCGDILPDAYGIYSGVILTGFAEFPCVWESDIITSSCVDETITLNRVAITKWSWSNINLVQPGHIVGGSCFGPLFIPPPSYSDSDTGMECERFIDEPLVETILPGQIISCLLPGGLGGSSLGGCEAMTDGFSRRTKLFRLVRKDETNTAPIVNWCKELKEENLKWQFVEDLEDTGILSWNDPTGTVMRHEVDGSLGFDPNALNAVTSATGSGAVGTGVYRPDALVPTGTFHMGVTPITVRPEFYVTLGDTRIICEVPE